MPTLYPTLRFLGLASRLRHARPGDRPVRRAHGADYRTAATDPRAARSSRRAPGPRRRRPPVLVWLGLVERQLTVSGHPRIRERAAQRFARRRRRSQVLTGSLGTVLLLVLGTWGLLRSPLMAVESVSVVGVDAVQTEAVLGVVSVKPGQNVLDVNLDRVRRQVDDLPWVEQATVKRRLPSTVEIRVATRQPVLTGVFGEVAYAIDGSGVVLGEGPTVGLPTVALPVAPAVGTRLQGSITQALALVAEQMPSGMNQWIVQYSAVSADEVDALLNVPTQSGPVELVVHLGRPISIPDKAATIASLVQETVGRGQHPRALDVSIPDQPVVLS